MSESTELAEYSIAAVSKLTGVSCHALRVWERRYGYPMPHRSASGHRRYSLDQVQALRRVAQLMRGGRPIGDLIGELAAGRSAAERPDETPEGAADTPSATELVDLLVSGDLTGAEACYQRLVRSLEPLESTIQLIEAALIDTGERWFRRECQVCQERCASGFLRRKLDSLIDDAQRANPLPRHIALLGTVQGDRHEGGILMLALLLERAGWRAILLGVDLPVREFQKAVELWRPDMLGVSFVLSRNINKRFQELEQIGGLPVFVGGRSILNYQGLARRHGLIPLPGSASQTLPQLLSLYEQWDDHHAEDRRP